MQIESISHYMKSLNNAKLSEILADYEKKEGDDKYKCKYSDSYHKAAQVEVTRRRQKQERKMKKAAAKASAKAA